MKPPIIHMMIILAGLILFRCPGYGQPLKTVTFDFKTGKFDLAQLKDLDNLKPGDHYQVKVIHLNTNLYKITVNKSDTSTSPALTVPSFGGFSISDLSTLVTSLNPGNIQATFNKTMLSSLVSPGIQMFDSKTGNLIPGYQITKPKTVIIKIHDTNIQKIKDWMTDYQKALQDNLKKLSGVSQQTDALVNNYNTLIIKAMIEYRDNNNDEYFTTANLTLNNLKDGFTGLRNQIISITNDVSDATRTYQANIWDYAETIEEHKQLKLNNGKLDTAYQAFVKTLNAAKDSLSASHCVKYILSIANVENSEKRCYISAEQQFSKDQSTLSLSITPRVTTNGLNGQNTTWTFPLRQRQFWAVSSGIFFSSLYNKAYSTLKTTSVDPVTLGKMDTVYAIKSEDPAKWEFGVNAMVRYSVQITDNYVYWQIGAGPGVTITDKVRARVMAGTGLAFGRTHKFVIDVGGIAGYTDQLSVLYKGNLSPVANPTAVTVSKLNLGYYISIGYLFN